MAHLGKLLKQWQNRRCIEKEDILEMNSNGVNSLTMSGIPEPSQDLPASCHSEPISHHRHDNLNCHVDELIEDWPTCKKLRPRVTFSEFSSMHIYEPGPSNSYNSEERKNFRTEALSEAIRIKRLLMSTPEASVKDSIKSLLKNKIVSPEEMVGIEHLVFSKSVRKIFRERQAHVRAVLIEQDKQRGEKMQEDSIKKLGALSALSSAKSVKRARIRAATAA